MEEPVVCTLCGAKLWRMKHPVAHSGHTWWDAEIRVCPHNHYRPDRGEGIRHDEWHQSASGWIKREP